MATQASLTTTGVSSTSAPSVVEVLPCSRNPAIWQHFNLVKMSDNTTKAQCKLCFHFLSSSSNSTLKAHINNKYCDALMTVPEAGQSSMGRDGGIFVYNPDGVREQFAGLVIQEALPFNHFDNPRMTRVFQNHLQSKYNCDHLDATERIQHTSNLKNTLDFEEGIYDEETQAGEAILLFDKEITQDEAASEARSNGSEDEINFD
ncbi:zinc finger, BED-type, phospholipase-like, homeodomain-like protein [Tanacetum coccineum]